MEDHEKRYEDLLAEVEGRFAAIEAMIAHLVWDIALSHPSPPDAIEAYMAPLRARVEDLSESDDGKPETRKRFAHSIDRLGEVLEDWLEQKALDEATPADGEPH